MTPASTRSRSCALSVLLYLAAAPGRESPPEEVRRWLASAAAPLATFEPGRGTDDLQVLRGIVGDARIVAIGEATHGSSEFFAFKHRALEFLVGELGFTDFALEASWAQVLATNEWVEHGKGDLEAALGGLSSLWRTEEYAALLAWMRAWNADPAHATKVRIHGMDMLQAGEPIARQVRAYLAGLDPELADSLGPTLERLGSLAGVHEADLEGVVAVFDELQDDFVARSSAEEWALARQRAVILTQRHRYDRKRGHDQTAWRDRCMADNVRWILRQRGGGARIVLSAHNGHVSRNGILRDESYGTVQSVGRALAEDALAAGDEDLSLVVIGTAFARGGFHASPAKGGPLAVFEIERPVPGGTEAELLAAGLGACLVDLRSAPREGPVRAWLDEPRPLLGVGGAWDPAWLEDEGQATTLPAEYDALLFVPEVTPARRLDERSR